MTDLQILQNKAARIILDLDYRSSASSALKKLNWKDLKTTYHHDMHAYNTRSKCNIRKTAAKHKWGHWTTINFASNNWNELPQETRQAKDLQTFKILLTEIAYFLV